MDNYHKVIDAPGLLRDPDSKAIVSVDVSAKKEHQKKKAAMALLLNKNKSMELEIKALDSRLAAMESMMDRIIKLLEK